MQGQCLMYVPSWWTVNLKRRKMSYCWWCATQQLPKNTSAKPNGLFARSRNVRERSLGLSLWIYPETIENGIYTLWFYGLMCFLQRQVCPQYIHHTSCWYVGSWITQSTAECSQAPIARFMMSLCLQIPWYRAHTSALHAGQQELCREA